MSRDRLLAAVSPEVVEAIEQLVDERVRAELEAVTAGYGSPWLSLEEGAEYLRVSVRTLQRRIARGTVRSTTLGRRRLLHRDDLEAATREAVAPTTSTAPPPRTLDTHWEEA